jgi:hypothetical protein
MRQNRDRSSNKKGFLRLDNFSSKTFLNLQSQSNMENHNASLLDIDSAESEYATAKTLASKHDHFKPLLQSSVLSPFEESRTRFSISSKKRRTVMAASILMAVLFMVMAGALAYLYSHSFTSYTTSGSGSGSADSNAFINYNSGSKAVLPTIPDRALVLARRNTSSF